MIRGPMLPVYDFEQPDLPGQPQNINDLIDGRTVAEFPYLLVGPELPERCEQLYLNLHSVIIPVKKLSRKRIHR